MRYPPPDRGDDGVPPFTRVVSAAIIPFLVVAAALLYLFPGETDVHFAWTIAPPITAMIIASAYIGGIWFFAQVVRLPRWSRVRHGFAAVLLFATLASAATFLHWERFHPGHPSFVTWVAVYLTTPVLVALVLVLNGRRHAGAEPTDVAIPPGVRLPLAAIGVVALLVGLVAFLQPGVLVDAWAWELTPLTARIVGAVLTLPGMVNVWMLADGRWSAFRWVLQAQIVSLVSIAGALVLARADLLWERPSAWLFSGGIGASLLAYVAVYTVFERRLRKAARAPH